MSLKQDLKKRIIEGMIQKCRPKDEYVVLVVDPHTAKIVSSCCRVYDVMDAGVLVLESLMLKREKLDMPAIYFIEPTEASVMQLIKDFSEKGKPQYSVVHLFFTGHVPDEIMKDIGASAVIDRVKTFKELNCDFLAFESRSFVFDRRSVLKDLYFPELGENRRRELDQTARQLVSLCLTMNEYPHIRYTGTSKICQDVAQKVEAGLNRLIAQLPDWEANKDRERGTLLIVDRSIDPIAPLMHEYTYQAMVNDLIKVKGEVAFIPKKADVPTEQSGDSKQNAAKPKAVKGAKGDEDQEKGKYEEILLGEEDNLWVDLRHQHIGVVMQAVSKKFSEFRGKNAAARLAKNEAASVKDMINAMKAMPEYQSLIRQYFKHLSLAEECMKHFDTEYLESISELEQDMATGVTQNKEVVKPKDIKNLITRFCQSETIDVISKLRLLMIYIISQGAVASHSRKELFQAAGITLEMEAAIINLKHLGIDLQRKPAASNRDPVRTQLATERMNRIALTLMRFVPILYETMSGLISDTLPKDAFPYLKEPPPKDAIKKDAGAGITSSRKRGGWRVGGDKTESKETEAAKKPGARFIVYVLGGVTFSEMRSAYELHESTKAQIYIGSTEALTPINYIRALGDFPPDMDIRKSGRKAVGGAGSAAAGSAAGGAGGRSAARDEDFDEDFDDLPPSSNLNIKAGRL